MSHTILWYDYETTGIDPARDRPLQFAAIRTNLALERIEDPVEFNARPPVDRLPHPQAVITTGITPRQAWERGSSEAQFIAGIEQQMAREGTITSGYNTLRFDDEVTRYTLYRNLRDPYAREWRGGNGRWDLIDLVRATHDLRPDGIDWPQRDDGRPDFRLDQLTVANGIEHGNAHDAVADVEATIALARLIRRQQPRLWEYAWSIRHKRALIERLTPKPVVALVHTSGMLSRAAGCTTLVAPLTFDRTNRNACHLWDLRFDPAILLDQSPDQLRRLLFTPKAQRADDDPVVALKQLHLNRAPFIAPAATLDAASAERLGIDRVLCHQHLQWIHRHHEAVMGVVEKIHAGSPEGEPPDPELALYSGGFFSDHDRELMNRIHTLTPTELVGHQPPFEDPRLATLLFRYRARNWPESLTADEQQRWEEERLARLENPGPLGGGTLSLSAYGELLDRMRSLAPPDDAAEQQLLDELEEWGEWLMGG